MSFFKLFFGKRAVRQTTAPKSQPESIAGAGTAVVLPAKPMVTSHPQGADERRNRRHARREQLYIAVRESMTRSGVLSASYKFKVLSLDHRGNEFLVMVDLSMDFEGITNQLGAMEAMITQQANARFGITVPTVYWRMDKLSASASSKPKAARPAHDEAEASPANPVKVANRRDPLEADEVAAFRQALLAASAKPPANVLESAAKAKRGVSSYTLLTGFEDTELPESPASPGLSKTQYGDLS